VSGHGRLVPSDTVFQQRSVFSHYVCKYLPYFQQAWAEGKGKLATCRHRADSGGETVKMYAAIV